MPRYLTDEERKGRYVWLRVSLEQIAELDAEAAREGVTRSVILRRRLLPKPQRIQLVTPGMAAEVNGGGSP